MDSYPTISFVQSYSQFKPLNPGGPDTCCCYRFDDTDFIYCWVNEAWYAKGVIQDFEDLLRNAPPDLQEVLLFNLELFV